MPSECVSWSSSGIVHRVRSMENDREPAAGALADWWVTACGYEVSKNAFLYEREGFRGHLDGLRLCKRCFEGGVL